MHTRAMTVCVNYADLLEKSLDRWKRACDEIVVVTAPTDYATIDLCRREDVSYYATDAFHADGARFNKGAALVEAVRETKFRVGADWLLLFDSDIVPPPKFVGLFDDPNDVFDSGNLYGAYRWKMPENSTQDQINRFTGFTPANWMPQGWVLGFFSLFHASDPHLPAGDLFDTDIHHAGFYDTHFTNRWHKSEQYILPLKMIHLGEERTNWFGRGNAQAMRMAQASPDFRPRS